MEEGAQQLDLSQKKINKRGTKSGGGGKGERTEFVCLHVRSRKNVCVHIKMFANRTVVKSVNWKKRMKAK